MSRTPFCPNCGIQVSSDASFCLACGANLGTIGLPTTGQVSAKEKGGVLEDSIADYFRRMGFDVQPRVKMRDRFDVSHEIDVLASKREAYGTIQVAVECKYVTASIDIKEVRNFHDKLSALGITKGVFVSTGGFTADAESHADALGIELWDMKTLQDKMAESTVPQRDIIHDAIPFNLDTISALYPRHLKNSNVLSETVQLHYIPSYFVDYHCFSEYTIRENAVHIESKGRIAIDGTSGQVIDIAVSTGQRPALPSSGYFIEASSMRAQTISNIALPAKVSLSVTPQKLDFTRAKEVAKIELAKNLTVQYKYQTTRTTGTKALRPKKKDVEILSTHLLRIPIFTGLYRYKNRGYIRATIGTTGKLVTDQTKLCLQCRNPPVLVCESCGGLACESHSKNCIVCGKNLCSNCVVSKGIISKKYYCAQHRLGD